MESLDLEGYTSVEVKFDPVQHKWVITILDETGLVIQAVTNWEPDIYIDKRDSNG
jgi:hypothetical protein